MGESAHLIDSVLFGDVFSSPDLRRIFADSNVVQKWLDVEAALAEAQADVGIIPLEAAQEIRRKARYEAFDLSQLSAEIESTSHPLVPLIRALEHACDGEAGQFVHWGATTQDITDTGTILLIREALELIDQKLNRLIERLVVLAREHRDTIMAGRNPWATWPAYNARF